MSPPSLEIIYGDHFSNALSFLLSHYERFNMKSFQVELVSGTQSEYGRRSDTQANLSFG
jgi:hypothetical protein